MQGPVTTTARAVGSGHPRNERRLRYDVGHGQHASAVKISGGGGQQWMQKYSETHGRPFWYNVKTGERTWANPTE